MDTVAVISVHPFVSPYVGQNSNWPTMCILHYVHAMEWSISGLGWPSVVKNSMTHGIQFKISLCLSVIRGHLQSALRPITLLISAT